MSTPPPPTTPTTPLPTPPTPTQVPNRLACEKSPYLLQHANNPVDWHPWGEEAFARARAEDKPIFLSIGYSTCHWCHVMEHESFEDAEVAALMNELFVNIKVDREERPDVDRVYMQFVQATTGSGGWPMSVWLTPALEPFYGGTYFPPFGAYGRPGFPTLCRGIAEAWRTRRASVVSAGARVLERLRSVAAASALVDAGQDASAAATAVAALSDHAARLFSSSYDPTHGGFGDAPKFPRPVVHTFLLRRFARAGDDAAAKMVLHTLRQMAAGGIHDHLGGGFHRYSTDRIWHLPHFEKMLYDQAQLVTSYVEAFELSSDASLGAVARDICDYVLRDLTDPASGAFYSAEDADSQVEATSDERREGAFYVFANDEAQAALGEAAAPFSYHYWLEPDGNAHDPHGEITGKNILHARRTVAHTTERFGLSVDEVDRLLATGRERLLALRAHRPRPQLDDKSLCAWNGMMIGALARAGAALAEPRYVAAAERAAAWAEATLFDAAAGTLARRHRDGETAIDGYLEDYAALADGLVDLHQATFDERWLDLAERLVTSACRLFLDDVAGGFFCTTGLDPSVLVRIKDDHDGAEPAGSSVMARVLIRLGRLRERPEWLDLAARTVAAFASRLERYPHGMPLLLAAALELAAPPVELVVAGEPGDPRTRALLAAGRAGLHPFRLVRLVEAKSRDELGRRHAWLGAMTEVDGAPAAYVCRDRACERPVASPDEVVRLVRAWRLDS